MIADAGIIILRYADGAVHITWWGLILLFLVGALAGR